MPADSPEPAPIIPPDPVAVRAAAELVDDLAGTASDWNDIGSAMRRQDEDDTHHLVRMAFDYDLTSPGEKERRAQFGSALCEMWLIDGRVYPPPLNALPHGAAAAWAATCEQVTAPLAASRLADLLWEARHPAPAAWARRAVAAYLRVDDGHVTLTRAQALVRAREIAASLRDAALVQQVLGALADLAGQSIGEAGTTPGIAFRAVVPLVDAASRGEWNDADTIDQVVALRGQVGHRSDLVDKTYALEARLTGDPERRRRLDRGRVEAHLAAAAGLEGLAKQVELTEAAQLARDLGHPDLERAAVVELQNLPSDDLGLVRLEASGTMSREQLDALVAQFVADDWLASLARFASYGPPTGTHADNVAQARALDDEFPIQAHIRSVRLTEGGMPRADGSGDDARVRRVETWHASFWSLIAAEVLDRIGTTFTPPSTDDIASAIANGATDAAHVGRAASALRLYWDGEFDAAALLCLPAVERRLRDLAVRRQLPIFKTPSGRKAGGYDGLGALLREMATVLDEDWVRYYEVVLTNEHGLNLRNDLAHGYADVATREQAALLLHVVLTLLIEPPPALVAAE